MVSTTAKPIGYYVSSRDKNTQEILEEMQGHWGSRFENLERKWKVIFRAAIATYQAIYQDWIEEGSSVSCIDCCIAGAGGDDFNIWDEQADLVDYIQLVANDFSEQEIENLIEALTAQIKA